MEEEMEEEKEEEEVRSCENDRKSELGDREEVNR